MRIINILQVFGGIPSSLDSFPIYEEQLSDDFIQSVEKEFSDRIRKNYTPEDDENIEDIVDIAIENGYFEIDSKNEIYLIWSDVNE